MRCSGSRRRWSWWCWPSGTARSTPSPRPSGILSPPNALFLIGLGALFFLALHFSVAFSRLSEETKILAQEVARLDREQRRIRHGSLTGEEDVVIGTVESSATNGCRND